MTKNQKTFAIIGAGVLLLLLFRKKKGAEKSLEGAPTEDSGMGGGGGGGFSPMPILPVITPVVTTPIASPLVTLPNGGQVPLSNLSTSSVQSGTSTIVNADTSANIGRATPPPTPTPAVAIATKPPVASASPTSAVKFADFDGDQNFQDQLL